MTDDQIDSAATPLDAAAATFNEIWYGDRKADASDYRTVADLDDTLQRYRPGAPAAPAPRGPAVPA